MKRLQLIAFLFLILGVLIPWTYFFHIKPSQKIKETIIRTQTLEPLVTLRGKLKYKLFPGPPEYSSVEEGDRPDYFWIVELDDPSFLVALNNPENELSLELNDILTRENAQDLTLCLDKDLAETCEEIKNQNVLIRGHLFHAHTVHHHTPLLMSLKEIQHQYPSGTSELIYN